MRKNLLLLLLTLFSFKAISQVSEVEKLQNQIKNHPQQDTTRVNLLNQMIILNALPASEIETIAKESLLISRKTGYAEGEGYALLGLGAISYSMGNYDTGSQYLQQADSIAAQTASQELRIYVLAQKAHGKNLTGSSKDAIDDLIKAEDLAIKNRR